MAAMDNGVCFQCGKGFVLGENGVLKVEMVEGGKVRHAGCSECICGATDAMFTVGRIKTTLYTRGDKTCRCAKCVGCECGDASCDFPAGSDNFGYCTEITVTPHDKKLYVRGHEPCVCGESRVGMCALTYKD